MAGLPPGDQAPVMTLVRERIDSFPRDHSPVEMAREIHELVRSASGADDPYSSIKHESNEVCRSCMPLLNQHLSWAPDPFSTALKLAIAGNMLDFGAFSATRVFRRDVVKAVETTLGQPLSGDGTDAVREAIEEADAILYIGDNAGECFFDRILLERLPAGKLTYAVRGGPILNDATSVDAEEAGIHRICRVVDTGDRAPGVLLSRCSKEFREAFDWSDMVIAKGQGNYESLSARTDRTYAFVTKVKCEVIARDIGYPAGSNVVEMVRT